MKKEEFLDKAKELICGERNDTHGDAYTQLNNVAQLWTAYLGIAIWPEQVAMCMALMKISRSKHGTRNLDDYLDLIGYSAIAGEMAVKQ